MARLIDLNDLVYDTSVPNSGGLQVGMYSGLTVTHKPTGISVSVNVCGSQHKNREVALDALEAALTNPHMRRHHA